MRPRITTTIPLCVAAAIATLAYAENRAEACGCLSPPAVEAGSYAVNQRAEQIIFEVEDGFVTAHVSIRYAGAPESFAWIVPVPSVPELALSPAAAFGLLDRDTAPQISIETRNLCPESEYFCRYHDLPTCERPGGGGGGGGYQDAAAGGADAGSDGHEPPVVVVDRQTVGSYDTIVFSAGDAAAAAAWLSGEGFIVNDTMAPYMQPYADAGMLFVAAKLVPGADTSEIQPLRMRFAAPAAMIPLQLTAVAAEPHLTVTAYIYGDEYFRPAGLPLVEIDPADLARDVDGRTNYPMLLARAIDLAGGRGFVAEYVGAPVTPDFDQETGCCNEDFDLCGIEGDGVCSCPGNPFDVDDCSGDEDLVAGVALLEDLRLRHTRLTRLTTRLSAEEMDHDPMFEPMPASATPFGRLRLEGSQDSLAGCEAQILEPTRYEAIAEQAACATTYCGAGECAATTLGAGCDCDEGYVARLFSDLDGAPSVTCVPSTGPVDYEAGGLALPSACEGVICAAGTCVDVGGFPTCACDPGNAAVVVSSPLVAICRPITSRTGTSGARDYTAPFEDIPVCAPPPPTCGDYGWLDQREVYREGVQCESSLVDPADLIEPDAPTCADLGLRELGEGGCGCTTGGGEGALGALFIAFATAFSLRRRRRRLS